MQAALPATDPFVPEIYRVKSVERELADVTTIEVEPLSGMRPAFLSGQFNMLYAFGIGEAAISISADLSSSKSFLHTIRNVGAVSSALTDLEVGATLGLRGPFGTGWPVTEAEGSDVLIVAGGLGLAPLRAAIHVILGRRERYGRVTILIGCRSPLDILYRNEIEQWRQRLDVAIEVTVDHADADWSGNVGVIPSLIPRTAFDANDCHAFVCGPEVMMRFTASALTEAGIGTDNIYVSMERNMKCAIGLCGRCQFGPSFVCKDGPVMQLDKIASSLFLREI